MIRSVKTKCLLLSLGLLLTFIGLNRNFLFVKQDVGNFDRHLISEISNDLIELSQEIDDNFRIIENNNKPLVSLNLDKPNFVSYFKLYKGKLIDWDGFEYNLPKHSINNNRKGLFSFENQQGLFVVKKYITSEGFQLLALIPVHRIYSIDNKYLNERIEKDFIGKYNVEVFLSKTKNAEVVKNNLGKNLFYISKGDPNKTGNTISWSRLLLLVLGVILLFGAAYSLFVFFEVHSKFFYNFIFLTLILFVLRYILLVSKFPNSIFDVEWFKSRYFASSILFPSFGDFTINLLCLLALGTYFFLRLDVNLIGDKIKQQKKRTHVVLFFFTFMILCFFTYLYYRGVFVLHKDAQWNFDISKSVGVNNYTLSYVIIFILLTTVFFLYSYLALRIVCFTSNELKVSKLQLLLFSIILLPFNFLLNIPWHIVAVFLFYFYVIVYFKLYAQLRAFNFNSYVFLILSAFSFSLISTFILLQNSSISEEINKKKYAIKILDNTDLELEYLLDNISKGLKKDSLVLKTLPNIWTSKDAIIARINNDYLDQNFEKYEIGIHLFDKFGNGYFKNNIDESYLDLRAKYTQKDYKTSTKNLYYLSTYGGVLQNKYVQFIQIKVASNTVGYIVLELTLKRVKEHSLYPLLVNNYETNKQLLLSGYDFAVYEKGQLVFNHGSFNYPSEINAEKSDFSFNQEGYNHYQTRSYKSKQIVISSPRTVFNVFIANFSYLFIILVFFVFIILFFVSFYNHKKLSNFSTKIQIFLNLACFLPLIVVSISTMSVINDNYKEDLNTTFIKKAQNIGGSIDEHVDRYVNKEIAIEELEIILNKMSKYTISDINLYNVEGALVLSSQKSLFELGLLSLRINPMAKLNLKTQKSVTLLEEQIGDFEYRSVYLSLRSPNTGKQIGLISIPFFNSEKELNEKRVAVLATYMSVFSIAFLLILGLSQLAYNSITNPLKFISDKLKRISFTGVNEELNWSSEDEIGLLVNEYNNMLYKLEESKKALSQSEKEFAWREMAQQVAHEIKNPLTPMKLSMQHMRRVGVDDPEKLKASIDSMLSQIETLNDIASSFSSFAKMPVPESELYDIVVVCREIVNLYDTEDVDLTYTLPEEGIYILGDDKVMSRILTNLVINGIQSYTGSGISKIELNMVVSSTDVLIEVKDNGDGIPEDIQSKIFVPNFSTKYTGSGIGLAVAKRGVEHAQGSIWFNTDNKGTSFFIKLPKAIK